MTKIEALKKTIYNLENDVYEYDWKEANNCNCGVVVRTILGGRLPLDCGLNMDAGLLYSDKAVCLKTGYPISEVFMALQNTGFSYEEIVNLEFYGNKQISEKLGRTIVYEKSGRPYGYRGERFNQKKLLLEYLSAWVEILEEQEPATPAKIQPQVKVITKYVAVAETLRHAEQLETVN